jgi:hypothetical protein
MRGCVAQGLRYGKSKMSKLAEYHRQTSSFLARFQRNSEQTWVLANVDMWCNFTWLRHIGAEILAKPLNQAILGCGAMETGIFLALEPKPCALEKRGLTHELWPSMSPFRWCHPQRPDRAGSGSKRHGWAVSNKTEIRPSRRTKHS